MRYFIIAGEQSGDLHGSNLIKGLLNSDPGAEIACWGGDMMQAAGANLLMHYRKSAFMGFLEVARNISRILKNISLCKEHILNYAPDVIILIDYPGFNLQIAEFAKKQGIKVFYYISPKIWAWKEKRVEKIKKYVDRMFIIFPFEVEFYKKHKIAVEYYGNPLVDEIDRQVKEMPERSDLHAFLETGGKPVIALLAGSRRHEVKYILPEMLKVVGHLPEYQFVLAGVRNIPDDFYKKILGNSCVKLIKEKTYEILYSSEAALVASGTATLETALIGTPQIVCYKGDFISMVIAALLVKVKFISLVNLVMDKEVVRELIQYDLTEKNILSELRAVLHNGGKRTSMLSDYKILKEKLGEAGASERIASEMVRQLSLSGIR
jgi:lipid-A-disaccharide synthase